MESSSTPDARVVRTDHALRHALLVLLDRKPLAQITIREIAAEAGVHYATFFRHHPTKEALLDHVAADQIDRLVELALSVRDPQESGASYTALCRYVSEHRNLWTTLLTGGAAGAMREELLRVSREVAAERAPKRSRLPVDLATNCAVSVIVETIFWWLGQPPRAYSAERVARYLQQLLHSAVIEPGERGSVPRARRPRLRGRANDDNRSTEQGTAT